MVPRCQKAFTKFRTGTVETERSQSAQITAAFFGNNLAFAQAEALVDRFARAYDAKYPKAVACLAEDRQSLLTHSAFTAAHWIHLRTTNLIEPPFATVRLRQRVTKGAGLRTNGVTMACGTSCVVTDVGDASVIVGDTGWVASPRNVPELAERIQDAFEALAEVGHELISERCRARIVEKFSLQKMVDAYLALWMLVANKTKG